MVYCMSVYLSHMMCNARTRVTFNIGQICLIIWLISAVCNLGHNYYISRNRGYEINWSQLKWKENVAHVLYIIRSHDILMQPESPNMKNGNPGHQILVHVICKTTTQVALHYVTTWVARLIWVMVFASRIGSCILEDERVSSTVYPCIVVRVPRYLYLKMYLLFENKYMYYYVKHVTFVNCMYFYMKPWN